MRPVALILKSRIDIHILEIIRWWTQTNWNMLLLIWNRMLIHLFFFPLSKSLTTLLDPLCEIHWNSFVRRVRPSSARHSFPRSRNSQVNSHDTWLSTWWILQVFFPPKMTILQKVQSTFNHSFSLKLRMVGRRTSFPSGKIAYFHGLYLLVFGSVLPIPSMYGIFTYMYHKNQAFMWGKYTWTMVCNLCNYVFHQTCWGWWTINVTLAVVSRWFASPGSVLESRWCGSLCLPAWPGQWSWKWWKSQWINI